MYTLTSGLVHCRNLPRIPRARLFVLSSDSPFLLKQGWKRQDNCYYLLVEIISTMLAPDNFKQGRKEFIRYEFFYSRAVSGPVADL